MSVPPDEIVLTIERYTLSNNVVDGKKSGVIIGVESYYHNNRGPDKKDKTPEQRAVKGSQFFIPWTESISSIEIFVYTLQDRLTCFVGQCSLSLSSLSMIDVSCGLYLKNCGHIVGNIYVSARKQHLLIDPSPNNLLHEPSVLKIEKNNINKQETNAQLTAPESFRFNRLSRPVNWERLRCLNLRRYVKFIDSI